MKLRLGDKRRPYDSDGTVPSLDTSSPFEHFPVMATIPFRTRIDRNLKKESDAVLKDLGLDAGSFVSMALAQLVNRRGLPFAVTESDANYFVSEYGLTRPQSIKAGTTMRRETARARRTGKLREVTGLSDLVP